MHELRRKVNRLAEGKARYKAMVEHLKRNDGDELLSTRRLCDELRAHAEQAERQRSETQWR